MQVGLTLKQIIGRRKYLGGSDISVISDMNQYQDSLQLWEFKKGIYTPTEDNISNKFTIAGNVFEDLILHLFKQRVKEDYDQDIEYTGEKELFHPDYKFLISHPDEVLTTGDMLDCKTANSKSFNKKWGDEQHPIVPKEYQYQLIYNAGVYYRATGIKAKQLWIPVLTMTNKDYDVAEILAARGELATWENLREFYLTDKEYATVKQQAMNKYNKIIQPLPDEEKGRIDFAAILKDYVERKIYLKFKKKFQIRVMNYDHRTFESIEKNAIAWWNKYMIGNERPPLTPKSVRYLKEKYKYAEESKEVTIGKELDDAVAGYKSSQMMEWKLKKSLAESEEQRDLDKQQKVTAFHEVRILDIMKDAETATGVKAVVDAYNTVMHSINYEKLKREAPEIYQTLIDKKILTIDISPRRLQYKDIMSK